MPLHPRSRGHGAKRLFKVSRGIKLRNDQRAYSTIVAAAACVAREIAEAAANSDRPIRIATMIFRVNFMRASGGRMM